jgi:hypothetical protein
MNAQTIQDIAVIAGMFFLRVGLPLLVVMGVGYLIQRWLEPKAVHEQFEGIIRNVQEQPATVTRWGLTNSAEAKRAACTQGLAPDIPCWLARQIAGESLPEGCMTCEVRALLTAQMEKRSAA